MLIKNGAKRVTLSLRQQWGSHHRWASSLSLVLLAVFLIHGHLACTHPRLIQSEVLMWSTGSLLYKLHKFEDLINWIIIGLQWIGWMKCLELTFAVICSYIDKSELNWGIFIQLSGFVFKPKEQILQIIWFNSWTLLAM